MNNNIFNEFINDKIKEINCDLKETQAYVESTLKKYLKPKIIPNRNIILQFIDAKNNHSFEKFQNTADWIFFLRSIYPESLNNASTDYYDTIGQISYYKCYKIINKEWRCFEELSDKFTPLVIEINSKFGDIYERMENQNSYLNSI